MACGKDLCSSPGDQTHVPCIGRQILNPWTAGDVPGSTSEQPTLANVCAAQRTSSRSGPRAPVSSGNLVTFASPGVDFVAYLLFMAADTGFPFMTAVLSYLFFNFVCFNF